jgi:hypothetical protein
MLGFAHNDAVMTAGALTLVNALLIAVYAYNHRPRIVMAARSPWRTAQSSAGFIHVTALLGVIAVLLIVVGLIPR